MQIKEEGFNEKLLHFVIYCRERKFIISPQQTLAVFQAASLGFLCSRATFKAGLKTILCHSKSTAKRFNTLFDVFWSSAFTGRLEEEKRRLPPKKSTSLKSTLIWLGSSGTENQNAKESKQTKGANSTERLMQTDFTKIQFKDQHRMDQLCEALYRQMSLRIKRRYKASNRGVINLKKTIRQGISKGGLFLKRSYVKKKKEKRKIVFLLDVSGSMDVYSFYLLKFIITLSKHLKHVALFTMSTRLRKISPIVSDDEDQKTLLKISQEVKDWSGGTTIGTVLETFIEQYGNSNLSQKHIVVVMSDGLETGNVGILKRATQQIQKRCKTLIWLNPLKGMENYQPIQKGMLNVMPHLDVFKAAHNLNSLLQLEQILKDV